MSKTVKNRKLRSCTSLLVLALLVCAFSGSAVAQRAVKTKVPPAYPELAKKMNVNGVVKVELTVLPSGSVKSAKAIGGHPLLIDAAVSAAKQFKYEASTEETKEIVEFKFTNGQ